MNNGDFTKRVELICQAVGEDLFHCLQACGVTNQQWESWRAGGGVRRSDAEKLAAWLNIPSAYLTERFPSDVTEIWRSFIEYMRIHRAATEAEIQRIFVKKAGELAGAKLRGRQHGVEIGAPVFEALLEGEIFTSQNYDERDDILPDETDVNWNDASLF